MTSRPSYLDAYENAPMPEVAQCVFESGGRLYFTEVGRRRYQERFARAGFAIGKIKNWSDFDAAMEGSYHIELVELEKKRPRTISDPLQAAMLRALEADDQAELERLKRKLQTRNQLRLVVNGEACRPSKLDQDGT